MLTNLSNHPISTWSEAQYSYASSRWGEIRDLPFPAVQPELSEDGVMRLVREYLAYLPDKEKGPVYVSGEYSFTYAMVHLLLERGYRVMYVQSENTQTVHSREDGYKERKIEYHFKRFSDFLTLPESLEKTEAFEPIFLNCSLYNRSCDWDQAASAQASVYGRIEELPLAPFHGSDEEQFASARAFLKQVNELRPSAVLLDGAFGTFYMIADALLRQGYLVLVKCSNRIAYQEMQPDGTIVKTSLYRFVRYRRVLPYTE